MPHHQYAKRHFHDERGTEIGQLLSIIWVEYASCDVVYESDLIADSKLDYLKGFNLFRSKFCRILKSLEAGFLVGFV